MTRTTSKRSMHAAWLMVFVLLCATRAAQAVLQQGNAVGPGVGGQVHAFAFDPDRPDTAYAGGDVCGIYMYDAGIGRWSPWSAGLGFGDMNRSFYVDDLLVLGADADVRTEFQGVYAATWGGVYFRGMGDASWTCITPSLTYEGGYAERTFFDGSLRIPFSCLAYDPLKKKLYAGAGHGRTEDDAPDSLSERSFGDFYPTTTGSTLYVEGEHSLWVCSLDSLAASVQEFSAVEDTDHGKVRQIAIANYLNGSVPVNEVIYACDTGLWTAGDTNMPLWAPDLPNKSADFDPLTESADPWGVVVGSGSDPICYVLTRASTSTNYLTPGMWYLPLTAPRSSTTTNWERLVGDNTLWPHTTLSHPEHTWSQFLSGSGGDLTDLSIVWNENGAQDAIYAGEGAGWAGDPYGRSGYFRYGTYWENNFPKTGWAHVIRTATVSTNGDDNAILAADWKREGMDDNIQEHELNAAQVGWHSIHPAMRTMTPMAANSPDHSLFAAVTVGIPLLTNDGSTTWQNLYCTGSAGGWTNLGLNLLCTGSSTFLPTGELVIGALDYGVFVGSGPDNSSFLPTVDGTDATYPNWPCAVDVEEVQFDTGTEVRQEIYMADSKPWGPDSLMHNEGTIWGWTVGQSNSWQEITTNLNSAIDAGTTDNSKITDMVFVDSDTVFVAIGKYIPLDDVYRFYICEGHRPASGPDWIWESKLSFDFTDPGGSTMWINRLCLIPNTTKMLIGARHKGDRAGGLYCVDYSQLNWRDTMVAWLGGDYDGTQPQPQTALGRLGIHVSAIAVDRHGQYAYAGCSGGDTPTSPGRGGLVRFPISGGLPGTAEILAGFGAAGTDVGDRFGIGGVQNFGFTTDTRDWEFCTRINDIDIDPNNPKVAYVAVAYGNSPFFHGKFGAWCVTDTTWGQVWGAHETGSGAKTVGISPVDYSKLYVGSTAQEFFVANIQPSAPPAIAAVSTYPLWAGATGTSDVFAVAITPADSIKTASVDLSSLGGPTDAELLDDGNDPDLVDGDGIFTSQRFEANVTAPGVHSVPVFAQANDFGYTLQDVAVTVVASAPAPVIASHAAYPVLAASTDTSTVLSVAVSSSTPIVAVNAALADLGGTGSVRLRDDGELEDVAPGDGIYTSTRFQAGMGTEGTHSTTVTAEPMYGAVVQQVVTVEAVAERVKFEDVSTRTGALTELLTANPYSSVYFKSSPEDDASADVMVVTFDDNSTWPLLLNKSDVSETGVPVFSNQSPHWLSGGALPEGGRGICYADYDNDGDNDLFICNVGTEAMLLENRLNDGGVFTNRTDEMFGTDHGFLTGSLGASWGDYNGDGFIDLLVTTTNYFGSVKNLTASTLSNQNITCASRIFRNVNGSAFQETEWGFYEDNNVHLAGCWADLDNDGDLDQISARFILSYLAVLKNVGYSHVVGDNRLVPTAWSISDPGVYFGANSVSVIDFDHNDYPDLLITGANRQVNGLYGVKILRNNYGNGQDQSFTAYTVTESPPWNGTLVADFDLDGQDDILLLPKTPNVAPSLFMANGYSDTAPTYTDRGYTAGLRGGETNGGFAADFDGDHSYDLFMGRVKDDQFLYRNEGQAPSSAGWLVVKLGTAGNSNGSLIGTKVVVTASGKRWTKTIDGGSGRGGQSSSQLLFGLGEVTGSVDVTVKYPSHEVYGSTGQVGSLFTDTEDSVATIKPDLRADHNPIFDYELQPGTADWIFKWRTRIKGDLTKDVVEVENFMGYASDGICGVGIEPQAWRTLVWGDVDADFRVYWDGLWWQHEVRWRSLPCGANCTYRFKVTSAVGTNSSTSVIRQTTPVSYCIPDAVPNEQ